MSMRNPHLAALFAVLVGLAAALAAGALRPAVARQGASPTGGRPPQSGATAAITPVKVKRPPGLRGDIQYELDDAEQKLIQLASVMPPDKFGWRPAPGVRSFGEVILHVAGGNYIIGAFIGVKPPPGVDLQKIERQGSDKGSVIAAARVSFEKMRETIATMPDAELDKQIDYFGHPGTPRLALIDAAVHAHEHLGQAIAYARANGVVPPWTAAEQQRSQSQGKPTGTGR
jgi:uncharacterized damage-inducible protein DinB